MSRNSSYSLRVIDQLSPAALELLQQLARSYIGPDVVFPAMPNPPPGFVVRIRVARVSGIGDWLSLT